MFISMTIVFSVTKLLARRAALLALDYDTALPSVPTDDEVWGIVSHFSLIPLEGGEVLEIKAVWLPDDMFDQMASELLDCTT